MRNNSIYRISFYPPYFITVIYPCKKTEGQTIEAVFTDNGYSANGASIKVTINGIEYPLSYILQSNNF